MREPSFDNPRYWHMRAEETRALAEEMRSPDARDLMQRIADDYDRLARLAEERLGSKS